MKRRLLFIAVLLWGAAGLALAQTYKPDELLVLIVGATADPISQEERAVVQRLNELRSQHRLKQLRLGTMHFDRPREAAYLRDVLGVRESDVVSLSLVQLDTRTGRPVRNLYTIPKVTRQAIDAAQAELLRQWSDLSGVSLPTALRPTGPSLIPARTPRPRGGEVMTSEGVLGAARQAEQASAALWNQLHNAPLRPDGRDKEVRRTLLGLVERTRLLRVALEEGIVNPTNRFQGVLQSTREFEQSEPRFYLPVELRPQVPGLLQSLRQVEQAYYQLNPGG